MHVVQFCNFMNETHHGNASDQMADNERPNVVTLLTGDKLAERKSSNFSYTGIMNAVSINFEQITTFYAKYKKK